MTLAVRTPKRFYQDCEDCETETPTIVKETANHYWLCVETGHEPQDEVLVSGTVPGMTQWEDIKSRAEYYANSEGFDTDTKRTICVAARHFLKALDKKTAIVSIILDEGETS